MLVIRQKDNHNIIKSFGYTAKGGLGEFDSEIYEEVELDALPEGWEQATELPIASGSDLVSTVEKAFIGQSFELRMQLQTIFAPIKNTLLSETCNPLSIEDFQIVLKLLDGFQAQLTPEQIALFKNLLVEFMNNHKFFDYKPEEVAKIAKKLQA